MDIFMAVVGLAVLGIVKIFPPKVAMLVVAGIFGVLLWITLAWRSSLAESVAVCNSTEGRFSQFSNGSAIAGCGLDSILMPVLFIVALGIGFLMLAAGGVWAYQMTHPEFDLKDAVEGLV